MKLVCALPSPFARKIRILLAEKGIPFEIVIEAPWVSNSIEQVNPLMQVPCLILDNDYTLFDSRVIEDYLEFLVPMHIPEEINAKLAVKKWAALADGMLDAGIKIRAETVMRPPELIHQPWLDRQYRKLHLGLTYMESHLQYHLWCANDQYSLADVATVSMLGFLDFRLPDFDWRTRYPQVAKLANYLNALEPYSSTLPHLG